MANPLLFNPHTYDPDAPRRRDPPAAARHRRLLRGARQEGADRQLHRPRLVRRLPGLRREGGPVRDVPDAGGRRRRRPGQTLGHRAQRRAQRDPRLLRPRLLVHLAGHRPRPRAGLAERQRQPPGRRAAAAARRRARDGVRPVRTRPRRRHLLHRHDPHPGRRRAASGPTARKYYIGNGNVAGLVSVFGRRADVDGPDGYVFFAADSRHPAYHLVKNVVNAQMYVSEFRLEDYPVRAAGRPAHRPGRVRRRARTPSTSASSTSAPPSIGICEHAMYEAVTHAHRPRALRQAGHRLPARAPRAHRRVRPAGRDEAVQRPRRRLLPLAPAPTTAATCCSTR